MNHHIHDITPMAVSTLGRHSHRLLARAGMVLALMAASTAGLAQAADASPAAVSAHVNVSAQANASTSASAQASTKGATYEAKRGAHRFADLTEDQRIALKQSREALAPERKAAGEQFKLAKRALQDAITRGADASELETLSRDLGEAEAAKHWVRARAQVELRAILTPEQRERFDKRGSGFSHKGLRGEHRHGGHFKRHGGDGKYGDGKYKGERQERHHKHPSQSGPQSQPQVEATTPASA